MNQHRSIDKLKNHTREIKNEIREKISTYVVAALGLVAGLAWNEAVKALIEAYFPKAGNNVLAKFLYALGISLIVIVVSLYVTKINTKNDQEKK